MDSIYIYNNFPYNFAPEHCDITNAPEQSPLLGSLREGLKPPEHPQGSGSALKRDKQVSWWVALGFGGHNHHNPARTFADEVDGDTHLALNEVLPNPKYLRIHAAICKVARMSGAARAYALEYEESILYRKFMEKLKAPADSDNVP